MDKKQKYREYCRMHHNLPIFFHPEWLDITTRNGSWDVVITTDKIDQITGVLPYFLTKKYKRPAILMPPLTPYGGIFITSNHAVKTESQIKNERQIIQQLIEGLPKDIVFYSQSFYYNFNNWLPFYWQKYHQTTRYSFVIDDLKSWSKDDIATNIRNKIKKAEKELEIKVLADPTVVYQQLSDVLQNKGIHFSLDKKTFLMLDAWLLNNDNRLILGAVDSDGKIYASIYVVFDGDVAYSLMIGSDLSSRQNGSVPFVIYQAILEVQKRCKRFDFEGSMLQSLFDLFAGFGGTMKPYYRIYKAKNLFWDIAYRIKSHYDKSNH